MRGEDLPGAGDNGQLSMNARRPGGMRRLRARSTASVIASMLRIVETDKCRRAAEADLFRPVFSRDILVEMKRALESDLGLTRVQTEYLLSELLKSIGDALVEGYEDLIPIMRNAVEDRHVLAAGVRAGAQIVVTFNVPDFPRDPLEPFGIEAQTPDDFVVDLWQNDPELLARLLEEQAQGLGGWTIGRVLERLSRDLPHLVALVGGSGLVDSK